MRQAFQRVAMLAALGIGAGALVYAQDYPYYGNVPYRNGDGYGSGYGGYDPGRIGYMDGQRDGQRDLYTGHSYRPTHDGNFKHADRGYNHHFGPKWQYKQAYRDGYMRGYERGYAQQGQRGYRRGWDDRRRDYPDGYRQSYPYDDRGYRY